MIVLPDFEALTATYSNARFETEALKERYVVRVARTIAESDDMARSFEDFYPLSMEDARVRAADHMARDMAYYRERLSSAGINFHTKRYTASEYMGQVNDLLERLTGFRTFVAELPEADDITKTRLDVRIECFQEYIVLEARKALRQHNLREQFGDKGYEAVKE